LAISPSLIKALPSSWWGLFPLIAVFSAAVRHMVDVGVDAGCQDGVNTAASTQRVNTDEEYRLGPIRVLDGASVRRSTL
jgi:hypothetical protein